MEGESLKRQDKITFMIAHGRANDPAPMDALAKLKNVSTALEVSARALNELN